MAHSTPLPIAGSFVGPLVPSAGRGARVQRPSTRLGNSGSCVLGEDTNNSSKLSIHSPSTSLVMRHAPQEMQGKGRRDPHEAHALRLIPLRASPSFFHLFITSASLTPPICCLARARGREPLTHLLCRLACISPSQVHRTAYGSRAGARGERRRGNEPRRLLPRFPPLAKSWELRGEGAAGASNLDERLEVDLGLGLHVLILALCLWFLGISHLFKSKSTRVKSADNSLEWDAKFDLRLISLF